MADAVSIRLEGDIAGQLREFAAGVRDQVMRPTVYAATRVVYLELRARAPVADGTLYGAVYHWHSERESQNGQQVYYVGVNKAKAPHWHLLEYGHWRVNKVIQIDGRWVSTAERLPTPVWVPAQPYIRPAYDASIDAAMKAALVRASERIQELLNGR
ncbi:HK97 gp10 family phage protein [Pigmentiphaga daeguensis]|uniref:HK97 gp10 family phage protein n=1 Tax=Pigmentiphaga daeguensis TaxID=414049 RepID=A0ABN1BAK0_9BURK